MGKTEKQLTGKHVLLAVLAFFGVIISVNMFMAYVAVDSFSGLETENPYSRGKAYNQELVKAAEQKHLGWTTVVEFQDAKLFAKILDKDGNAVTNKDLRVFLRRPATNKEDKHLVLVANPQGGYISEKLENLLDGRWSVQLDVFDPFAKEESPQRVFRQMHEIWYQSTTEQ